MCRPVASLAGVTGNGGVRSRDEKPNGNGSHHWTQGKAKIGMVNESEPSLKTPSPLATETMVDTVVLSRSEKGSPPIPERTPQTPAQQKAPNPVVSRGCGTG